MSNDQATKTRILLVDDHALVRAGLRELLNSTDNFVVCGESGDLKDAAQRAEITRPDLIALDVELPDGDGIESLQHLQAKARGAKVLVLSMHDDAKRVEQAFNEGASGYLLKDAAESELVTALETIVSGDRYLYPPLGAAMVRAAGQAPSDTLTDREREIARLLALGHTNAEIASTLHLSVRTIETHRAHTMTKLRIHTRAELVRWALDSGLME